MATLQEHLSDVVDAIVFIFDPLEPDSFLDILPWARMAKMYEPEVLLCVAWSTGNKVRVDSGKKDSWFEWCISNGWEWVDLTDDDPETEYTVDRVREALVSNQWSTMVMKQLQSKNRDSDKIDSVSDAVDVAKPEGARELTEWDAFDKIAGSIDDTRIKDIHRRFLADGEIGAGAGAGETLDFDSPENDSDGQGDEFSTIVSRIRAMRVEISQMTDKNEARKRAAEMAMVLTNFGR
ncbi:Prefoldin subunit 5 [Coemansia sp. RSA 2703]|nr:Prefoldin subunit 5 [Coemansia sp. RSA 2703]